MNYCCQVKFVISCCKCLEVIWVHLSVYKYFRIIYKLLQMFEMILLGYSSFLWLFVIIICCVLQAHSNNSAFLCFVMCTIVFYNSINSKAPFSIAQLVSQRLKISYFLEEVLAQNMTVVDEKLKFLYWFKRIAFYK